jgi:hypothetical protein
MYVQNNPINNHINGAFSVAISAVKALKLKDNSNRARISLRLNDNQAAKKINVNTFDKSCIKIEYQWYFPGKSFPIMLLATFASLTPSFNATNNAIVGILDRYINSTAKESSNKKNENKVSIFDKRRKP